MGNFSTRSLHAIGVKALELSFDVPESHVYCPGFFVAKASFKEDVKNKIETILTWIENDGEII